MKEKQNKSIFLKCLGDTPQLRVFDFLIDNQMFDFPMTEIAKQSNVSYNSIKIFFPQLINSGVLIPTRKIGKSEYFKFNVNHPFSKSLIQLDWGLVKRKNQAKEVCI